MWIKTITVKFKGKNYIVLVFLSESPTNGTEVVTIQSMANEYYLVEKVILESRDKAHDFIKHYPPSMAKAFLIREGYENNAFE